MPALSPELRAQIVAVLDKDPVWGDVRGIEDLPTALVERLRHYFGTYKLVVGEPPQMVIEAVYGRDHAFAVVRAALEDYEDTYSTLTPSRG